MDLAEKFLRQIKENSYWEAGDKVVLGLSGGVDSMVLFDLLNTLPDDCRPAIHAAHINHQLRDESDDEEMFVREWMDKYNIPLHTLTWKKSDQPRAGTEKEARQLRYRFFEEIAEKVTSSFILTAHHRDDQVETVLMRLVRGSSLKELRGISTKRRTGEQEVLRLLLPYSKDEITNYAKTHKIPWKEDSSNLSSLYTRNRYRHDIIPRLKKENPAVEQHICDFSNDLNDLLDAVEPLIKEEHDRSFTFSDERIELDLSTFITKDRGFQKIVLSSAFERWRPQAPFAVSRSHIHQLIDWFQRGGPNTHLELPSRLSARKAYNKCIIEESNSNEPVEDAADSRELPLDQWLTLSETERVGCFTPEVFQKMKDENGAVIYLGDDGATWPLSVRHRRPGDRIKVKGLNGTKKIKDIFIDQKVPKDKRRKAWVVTDKIGRIVWLIGYKESTLSLNPLTDTIIYVLVYQNAATTKR